MEDKRIKIKITTISTGNPVSDIKEEGTFRSKDGKTLISCVDKEGVKTSFIITDSGISLSRSSQMYSLKIPVREEQITKGMMGDENTFEVIGKTVEFSCFSKGARVYLEYNLPDLSDTPMDFKVEAEIQF